MYNQSDQVPNQAPSNGVIGAAHSYDPFTATNSALAASANMAHQVQTNPYSQDASSLGGTPFYQGQSTFQQPVSLLLNFIFVANATSSFNITFTLLSGLTTRIS